MTKLNINDHAPQFEAITDDGKTVNLTDLKGKKVILYFYPKDDTSGCTKQACGFRDHYQEIEDCGAEVIGVSPDNAQSHQKFKTKHSLPFTLLVDADHKIAEAYGVWGEKSMYGKKYMGIIRSHFVIDENGKLIDVQYKVKPQESVKIAKESLKS